MRYVEPDDRAPALRRLRAEKMADSPHRFVRGATELFYEWLRKDHGKSIPDGPSIWICGDCHLGNLGPIEGQDGSVDIAIRDLDQTTIGHPAHDVVRLALSLSSAARSSALSGAMTARILETIADAYAREFGRSTPKRSADVPTAVRGALKASKGRSWKALAEERIDGPTPEIPLGRKFWPLTPRERSGIEGWVATEEARRLVASLRRRPSDAQIRLEDAAYWVKGCSSLGLGRYAALVSIERDGKGRDYGLIDLKEARPAIAPRATGAKTPKDEAERVVTGASALSPQLGERMVACHLFGKAFFARELMPADLKLEIEKLPEDEALDSARYLASVVGRAHRRQMKADERAAWKRELDRRRSKSLDAPSWLWSSVVNLLANHERAYLDHCRRVLVSADA